MKHFIIICSAFVFNFSNVLSQGKVGINFTNPLSSLHVNGNMAVGYSTTSAASNNGLSILGNTAIGFPAISEAVTTLSKFEVNGPVAIGYSTTTTVTGALAVAGNFVIGNHTTTRKLDIDGQLMLSGLSGTGNRILEATNTGKLQAGTNVETGVPIGTIIMFAGSTPPAGWIICNGQSTASYPLLAAIVGANVPDLRGRFAAGFKSGATHYGSLNINAGSDVLVNNATNATYAPQANTLAWTFTGTPGSLTGGAHTHTVTEHAHTVSGSASGVTGASGNGTFTLASNGSHTHGVRVGDSTPGSNTGAAWTGNTTGAARGRNSTSTNKGTSYTGQVGTAPSTGTNEGAHTHTVARPNHTHTFAAYELTGNTGATTNNLSTTTVNTNAGGTHTHAITPAGTISGGTFTGTANNTSVLNPYTALHYIIKSD